MIFLICHIVVRHTITDLDHATTVLLINMLSGFVTLVLQLVYADRLNLWYVKAQFFAGRSTNESKQRVWDYPAALGSTARTRYNDYSKDKDYIPQEGYHGTEEE